MYEEARKKRSGTPSDVHKTDPDETVTKFGDDFCDTFKEKL